MSELSDGLIVLRYFFKFLFRGKVGAEEDVQANES